jgi:hypothetical protein
MWQGREGVLAGGGQVEFIAYFGDWTTFFKWPYQKCPGVHASSNTGCGPRVLPGLEGENFKEN